MSTYLARDLEQVVLPLATQMLNCLAVVTEPDKEMSEPKGDQINWQMVNSMAKQLCALVVECVQCARPQDWTKLSIEHSRMHATGRVLEQTIEALFTPKSIEFLKAIYMRMRAKKVLHDEHLAPFLTSARIKQYRIWYP